MRNCEKQLNFLTPTEGASKISMLFVSGKIIKRTCFYFIVNKSDNYSSTWKYILSKFWYLKSLKDLEMSQWFWCFRFTIQKVVAPKGHYVHCQPNFRLPLQLKVLSLGCSLNDFCSWKPIAICWLKHQIQLQQFSPEFIKAHPWEENELQEVGI